MGEERRPLAAEGHLAVEEIAADSEVHGDAHHKESSGEVGEAVGGALGVDDGSVADTLGKEARLLLLRCCGVAGLHPSVSVPQRWECVCLCSRGVKERTLIEKRKAIGFVHSK